MADRKRVTARELDGSEASAIPILREAREQVERELVEESLAARSRRPPWNWASAGGRSTS
jgi:hypothetical protein